MDGMTPTRLVHYVRARGDFTECLPLLVVEVHSLTVVSGKLFARDGESFETSVGERGPEDVAGEQRYQVNSFHDPRKCVVHLPSVAANATV